MDMLQLQRIGKPNAPPRRPRSVATNNRRSRSVSSESHRRNNDRHRSSNNRRQAERRQTAERAKSEMMNQHKMFHELHRVFGSGTKKRDVNRSRVGAVNEGERNAWIYLVVSQCVVLATVARFVQNTAALVLCILQFILSLFATAYLLRVEHGYSKSDVRSQNMMSLRITLLSIVLQSAINSILLGRSNDFAVTGLSIANNNMLVGCWVSFYLISYLFGSAVASVLHESRFKSGSNLQLIHQFCRRMTLMWTMHLLSQICVLSSSISIQVSSICGGLLGTTASCQGVTASLILSVFNIPVCIICLLNIFSFVKISDAGLVKVYGLAACISLFFQAITTGLLTSVGGLASNPGNLYISTWINTLISLIIVLRCMDGYWSLTSMSSSDRLTSDDLETAEESSVAFQPAQPRAASLRLPSVRSSNTSSTEISQDKPREILLEPPPLSLPAPSTYAEPSRELVLMNE